MIKERFRWLAAVIAAHPNREVVGRTRLQKTIKLLQRLGLPTDYSYTSHFYGPYSEGVKAEIGLLEMLDLAKEEGCVARDGSPYYIIRAEAEAAMPELKPFQKHIDAMTDAPAVVLALAATYDAFRAMGSDHKKAMARLHRKKGSKCDEGNDTAALDLLKKLGLPVT